LRDRERIRQTIIEKFREVTRDRLERLNLGLVKLEKRPHDTALADEIMREIHTMKGEARMVGFSDVNLVAHKVEDLLRHARSRDFDLSGGLGDLVLGGLDAISLLIHKKSGVDEGAVDLGSFASRVESMLAGTVTVEESLPEGRGRREEPPQEPILDRERAEAIRTSVSEERSLRIGIEKLDALSDLVGDMLLTRVRLLRQFDDLFSTVEQNQAVQHGRDCKQSDRLEQVLAFMREQLGSYDQQLDRIEGQVRALRLVPISWLFNSYPRVVRDLAREQEKRVEMTISGGQVELDKRILDELGETLLHVLRNAVDHGIERPAERQRAGKPAQGSVALRAHQAGGQIEIVVEDDGAGIDPDLVLVAAREKGIVSDEEAAALTYAERIELLFRAGLSTRQDVSDLSGRGIGLDVAKQRMEALGGSVCLESTRGHGTRVVMKAPITLAIIPAFVVDAAGSRYAIPSLSIERIVTVAASAPVPVGSGVGVRLGGEMIPWARLATIVSPAPSPPGDGEAPMIVVRHASRLLALEVEQLHGEHELVQKPMDPFLCGLKLYSGTVTMPEGDLALVINSAELLRMAAASPAIERPAGAAAAGRARAPQTILVVEDSEITRDLVVEIVRSMGYQVLEAVNGQDALAMLQQAQPDLILTDIEMPVMDGFELLARVRGQASTREIPVVILTTRGSEEDRRRALALGADSYFVKSEFHEQLMIDTVRRFLGR